MSFKPFSVITSKIFAGTSIALLMACAVCWFGWSDAAHQRDDQIKLNGALSLKLSVSNTSIALLQSKIDSLNADALKRSAQYDAAKKLVIQKDAANAKLAKDSDAQLGRLKAMGARKGDGNCPVPGALANELGGL